MTYIPDPHNPYLYGQRRKWYQKSWFLFIIIFILVIVALFVLLLAINTNIKPTNNENLELDIDLTIQTPERRLAEKTDRPQIGNPNAKLVIVEFSDFQCPSCQKAFPIIREITNEYADDILFIYRQYPVINDYSIIIAQASLCANDQGKFWPMHDKLFLTANNTPTNEDLTKFAIQSGVDSEEFTNCMKSEKHKNTVLADAQDGLALGVSGTPTFFINGHKLTGVIPKENWEMLIDTLLKNIK